MRWKTSAWCAAAVLGLAVPASAGGYGFAVDVHLSQKAAAELQARNEAIIVFAGYEGEPVPAKAKLASDEGTIDLGYDKVTVPGRSARVSVTGQGFKRERLDWVKVPRVLVNVYTARQSGPDNLLDCDAFYDSVAKAREKPIPIRCRLIGEHD